MKKKLLQVNNLTIAFEVGNKLLPAVEKLNFHVDEGEIVGIVGESGCGKSVTFMGVMGLLPDEGKITEGSIFFEGHDLVTSTEKKMRQIRGNDISIIFQEPMTSLNPVYRVGRQISESLLLHTKLSQEEAKQKTLAMMEMVGLPHPQRIYNQYPHELSGGMRQRVMIAMALVCEPKLLIADEPTTALDVTIQAQILDLIKRINRETGTSVAFISHDIGIIREMCHRVLVMYAGHIIEVINAGKLLKKMQHPYTIGLVNSIPRPGKKGKTLYAIPGRVLNLSERKEGCRFVDRCEFAMDICRQKTPPMYNVGENHLVKCYLAAEKGGTVCEE